MDFTLQLHPELELKLEGVLVQPGNKYSILLGSDILNGGNFYLEKCEITPGVGILWKLPQRGVKVWTPQINPVHAKGKQAATATTHQPRAPSPPATTQPPAELPVPPMPPGILSLTTTVLTQEVKEVLQKVADKRQQ